MMHSYSQVRTLSAHARHDCALSKSPRWFYPKSHTEKEINSIKSEQRVLLVVETEPYITQLRLSGHFSEDFATTVHR